LSRQGIAHDVAVRANAGKLDADQLDTDWIISPDTRPVPWIWIRALSAAWERYKTEGGPLGRAFGLEGGGQGKSPTIDKLAQMLDERAIARWIGSQLLQLGRPKRRSGSRISSKTPQRSLARATSRSGGPGNGSALWSGSVIQNDRNFPEVVTQRAAHAKA
jgi:hypothetical protein